MYLCAVNSVSSMKKYILPLIILALVFQAHTPPSVKIALLKYGGGGDWYANPTSLGNLVDFCNKNLGTQISTDIPVVDAASPEILNYPFVHMTGHGNVVFTPQEVQNLRTWLLAGGFLHIDDNYGMDKYIRPQLKKIFPEYDLVEIPFDHPIYNQKYTFRNGLPKIHEHDGGAPQGFGIFHEGRMLVFYTFECDLGDGWEDPQVHKDSPETRAKALQMGANIVKYVFTR